MKKIQAWGCDYCNKFYRKTKKTLEWHEERCFYNPERRACQTCKHFERIVGEGWFCAKKEEFMALKKFKCEMYAERD